jgi:ribosomal protein S27AE
MTRLIDRLVEMFLLEKVPNISQCPNCNPDTAMQLVHEESYCTNCGSIVLAKKEEYKYYGT